MDAIDILGGMLGRKIGGAGGGSAGGSLGGKILKDMLDSFTKRGAPSPSGGAPSGGSAPQRPPSSGGGSSEGYSSGGNDPIDAAARSLEEMLGVAVDRHNQRGQAPRQQPTPQRTAPREEPMDIPRPAPPSSPTPTDYGQSRRPSPTPSSGGINFPLPTEQPTQNDQALVLIRAMVNAAKADGQLSQTEQQAIMQQVGEASAEMIQFLREEFAKPLDVREFCWSVPLGLEPQVYSLSVIAMDLRAPSETSYLRELAHGLRLKPEMCNQIHQKMGAAVPR